MNEIAELQKFKHMAAAVQEHQPSTIALVQQAMATGNIDLVERLMTLHEKNEKNMARRAFDAAIAEAKAQGLVVKKNCHVGYGHKSGEGSTDYDHEDFAEIARTIDPVLGPIGLSYRFRVKQGDKITVTCILAHRDGHFEENELNAPADTTGKKNAIQAIGSTITYLQRYTLKSALGLAAAKDDDGKGASQEPELISPKQQDELLSLAEQCGVDKVKFCRWAKIDSFEDILATDFEKAKSAILAKGKANA